MIDIDEQKKQAKFQKFQAHIEKDVAKKNKPKTWEEVDELEKQEMQLLCSDDELSPESKRKRIRKQKPDMKQFKQDQVSQYLLALESHRKQPRRFHSPFEEPQLHLNIQQTVKVLEEAKDRDKDIPLALKKVGIKSLKTLYLGGAKKQFELVINFLRQGKIPGWIKECHNQLMQKSSQELNGTVKGYLKPFLANE